MSIPTQVHVHDIKLRCVPRLELLVRWQLRVTILGVPAICVGRSAGREDTLSFLPLQTLLLILSALVLRLLHSTTTLAEKTLTLFALKALLLLFSTFQSCGASVAGKVLRFRGL